MMSRLETAGDYDVFFDCGELLRDEGLSGVIFFVSVEFRHNLISLLMA